MNCALPGRRCGEHRCRAAGHCNTEQHSYQYLAFEQTSEFHPCKFLSPAPMWSEEMRYRRPVPVGKKTGKTRPDGRPIQGDSCILQANGYGLTLVYVFAITQTKRLSRWRFCVRS